MKLAKVIGINLICGDRIYGAKLIDLVYVRHTPKVVLSLQVDIKRVKFIALALS